MPPRNPSGKKSEKLATVGMIIYSRQFRIGMLMVLTGREALIPVDLGDGGVESIQRLSHVQPQVLLIDLPKERLTTLLRAAHVEHPTMALLAVNCDEAEGELLSLFEAGLTGFVPHDAGPEELLAAIRDALAGQFHCPPRIAAALVRRVNAAGDAGERAQVPAALSTREAQVARLLERSLTNKEIASRLGLEVSTVRNHVYSICRKLDAHRRSEVVSRLGAPPLRVLTGHRGRARNS